MEILYLTGGLGLMFMGFGLMFYLSNLDGPIIKINDKKQ